MSFHFYLSLTLSQQTMDDELNADHHLFLQIKLD